MSIFAVAAAAEVLQQTHVRFDPSGGMVISSDARTASRPVHTDAEILAAAKRLNFPAILPKGLPNGARPMRLFTAGTSMLAITYDLADAHGRSPHALWILIANRKTTTGSKSSAPARLKFPPGKQMSVRFWHVGQEAVIAVSSVLTSQEFSAIERAMEQQATR